MELTDSERDLLLAALVEVTNAHADDAPLRARAKALALKLGKDPDAFDPADADRSSAGMLDRLPGVDDEPDGVYDPRASHDADDEGRPDLAHRLGDCIANGAHHLATLDHPKEGMVVGCTHCYRFWRTTASAE